MTGSGMKPIKAPSPRLCAAAGTALLLMLALPPLRHALELGMWRHMALQFPLLMLAGALLASGLLARARTAVQRWNAHGASGLLLAALVLSLSMVPRLLDLALLHPGVEAAKFAALMLAGATLCLSWRPAGVVLQFFFLGNVLGMMAVVGMLYIDSPLRLCNAYLLDDQARLGRWLVGAASVLATLWLGRVGWLLGRDPAPEPARPHPGDVQNTTVCQSR